MLAFFVSTSTMNKRDCFNAGFILRPHGLKGEVTVSLEPDFPEDIDAVFLEDNGGLVPYFIQSFSAKGNKAYLKFDDIDSVEAAEAISKKPFFLPRTIRPKAAAGEFYDDEVPGFTVVEKELGTLGTVQEVVQAGPNKLIMVLYGEKEVLIPVEGPFITKVNRSRKQIEVTLPEGFLDI